jgi:hypothetical protein
MLGEPPGIATTQKPKYYDLGMRGLCTSTFRLVDPGLHSSSKLFSGTLLVHSDVSERLRLVQKLPMLLEWIIEYLRKALVTTVNT